MGLPATVGSILETDTYFNGNADTSPVGAADLLRASDFIIIQTEVDTAPPNIAGIIAVEAIVGTTVSVSAADLQVS